MTETGEKRRRLGGREATAAQIAGAYAISVGDTGTPLPEGWKRYLLSDLARMESGHTPSRRHPEYWGGSIPWIGIRDATGNHGRTIFETNEYTNELGIANSASRVLPKNTVCLSRTASVGYVVVMGREMATSQDFANWICGPNLDHRYLKYALIAEGDSLLNFASGSVHQTIYFPELKSFHIAAPERPEQSAIADTLSALDDKIELNRRMTETLESMAQAIFRDWFVNFGPVQRKMAGARDPNAIMSGLTLDPAYAARLAALFPDTLGDDDLPMGWELSSVGDWMDILDSKRIPLSSRQRNERKGNIPYHGATSVMGYVDTHLFDEILLLVGEDGSVERTDGKPFTQYVWGKTWVNNHAHVLRGKGITTEHLKCFFEQVDIAPFVTGAVQPKLNQANMKTIPFVAATDAVNKEFGVLIEPLFAQIRAAIEETKTLAETRDYLLPRLMSGEVRVGDAALEIAA